MRNLALLFVLAACRSAAPPPAVAPEEALDAFSRPAFTLPQERYLCPRAATPPTIDGKLDDEAWKGAPWTDDFVDIESAARPRYRTRAKMCWDGEHFYVAAFLQEPHVWATLTKRDSVIFHDNDFEVFIDPDADTHDYYELEINALGTEWDLFLAKPYRDGGPALHAWDIAGLRSAVHVYGTINDPRDVDQGWSVEIAFPWAVLKEAAGVSCPPRPGDRWRVNFSRVEWRTLVSGGRYKKKKDEKTGKPLPEDNWVWSVQGIVNMHYPEMWGIVQFSDATEIAAGVEVPELEEDRVRALLRQVYYWQRGRHELERGYWGGDGAAIPAGFGVEGRVEATTHRWEARTKTSDGRRFLIREDGWVGETVR